MARCSAAGRTSALVTAARGPSLYGVANRVLRLREVAVYNTTAVEVAVGLARASTTGTQGAGLTEIAHDQPGGTVLGTAFNTHSADATVGSIFLRAQLGAAIGSGRIWVFGENGLVIPASTSEGIVVLLATGNAQHLDFEFTWDE